MDFSIRVFNSWPLWGWSRALSDALRLSSAERALGEEYSKSKRSLNIGSVGIALSLFTASTRATDSSKVSWLKNVKRWVLGLF